MLRVGLTGGLACGKTTVARWLKSRGVHVVYADQIARELMEPGKPVYVDVVKHFGLDIVLPDGAINRRRLAEKAFSGNCVQELNKLVHPAVIARQREWMDQVAARDPDSIAVVEAALIFEASVQGRFDRIVVVTCTSEQRIERFAARAGMTLPEARLEVTRRMAAQVPDAEKIKAADLVIENTGTLAELDEKCHNLLEALQSWNLSANELQK
jgi:dephospho-CoA kinase